MLKPGLLLVQDDAERMTRVISQYVCGQRDLKVKDADIIKALKSVLWAMESPTAIDALKPKEKTRG